jgi:hypothetical protein
MTKEKDKQERPIVLIQPQTANTIGVKVITNNGTAWLYISHNSITVNPDGLEVEVRP